METRPYTGTPTTFEDQVSAGREDRRSSPRLSGYHADDLRVEPEVLSHGSAATAPPHAGVGAKFADLSETGIGLLVLSPLRVSAVVDICVDLYRDGAGEELKARAEVVHCRAGDDGSYRVGLAFRKVDWRPLDSSYYPDLDN
jgi:hypothetical protein